MNDAVVLSYGAPLSLIEDSIGIRKTTREL